MKQVLISIVFCYSWLPSPAQAKTDAVMKPLPVIADTVQYATLYVYRENHGGAKHLSYDLYEDDSVICRVRNDSKYIVRLYKEGKITFWAKTEAKATKEVDVKYGMEYYLKCDVTKSGVFVMRPTLQLMYEEYGKFDFKAVEGKNSAAKD